MPSNPLALVAAKDLLAQKVDGFFLNDVVTGYGVAFAADEAWNFIETRGKGNVIIQGFGCVGASCAFKMMRMGYTIIGIADAKQFVYSKEGLDIDKLILSKDKFGIMNLESFSHKYNVMENYKWFDYQCDILVPAALEDVINKDTAENVKARLVVEGANIPTNLDGDRILIEKGIKVIPDFIANMGAIRFFDRVSFSMVEFTTKAIIDDIESIARRNVSKIFNESRESGEFQRDIAKRFFAPSIQDDPDIYGEYVN